mmetsp:Transcript_3765/g.14300  ORF Transcript_3765/g.14300 Transcript_3765/m.14300 type:complete len:582 (-) Transcript_3765:113-1858(-)
MPTMHHHYHHNNTSTTPGAPAAGQKSVPSRRRSLQPTTLVLNPSPTNASSLPSNNNSGSNANTGTPQNSTNDSRPPMHHFSRTGTPSNSSTTASATPLKHHHVHHVRTSSLPPRYVNTQNAVVVPQQQSSSNPMHPRRHSTTSVEGYNTLHGLASLNGVGLMPHGGSSSTQQGSSGATTTGKDVSSNPTSNHPSMASVTPSQATIPALLTKGNDLSIKGFSWSSTPKKQRIHRQLAKPHTLHKGNNVHLNGTQHPLNTFRRPGTPVRHHIAAPVDHVARQLDFETESQESASVDALLVGYDDETVDTLSVLSDTDDILTIMSLESMESDRSSVDFMQSSNNLMRHSGVHSNPPSLGNGGGMSFPFYQHSYQRMPSSQPSLNHMRKVTARHSNPPDRPKKGTTTLRNRIGKRKNMGGPPNKSISPSKLSIQGKTTKFTQHNDVTTRSSPPAEQSTRQLHLSPSPSRRLSASSSDSNDITPSQFSYSPSASTIHTIDGRHSAMSQNIQHDESIEDISAQLHGQQDDAQSEGFEHLEDLYKYFGYLPQSCNDEKKDILRKHDSYADLVKPLLSPKNHTFHQLET